MLPPAERLVGAQLHRYIKDNLYWVLHAPRQTGKTTFLKNWMREINAGNEAIACYVSIEDCQGITDLGTAMRTIYRDIIDQVGFAGLSAPKLDYDVTEGLLRTTLSAWSKLVEPKPLIVLFDEVDVLEGEVMISFLRQLRSGFAGRGVGTFPVSIALVGMRDLKDYITASKDGKPVNPGSPFNIKADSAKLSNFLKEDIVRLFAQRTEETGQQITQEALDYVYDQSKGQPWIVNSLFARATLRILDATSTETVTLDHVYQARQQMIDARETHLDALALRLEDPPIRFVIDSIISGEPNPLLAKGEPFRICIDLGLVTVEDGTPQIANPIYREVIAREITYSTQLAIPKPDWRWKAPDETLDMDGLLREFQDFWQTNSETWEQTADYSEAFPHLLLMAFLQRVTNGYGRIEREYAAGRGRMDLAIEYNGKWDIIEIKLLRKGKTFENLKETGIRQVLNYRNSFSPQLRSKDGKPADCYLIIFDRRPEASQLTWEERIKWMKDGEVTVLGC
jgi:hypothetical protein